jgi:hypothetical protein
MIVVICAGLSCAAAARADDPKSPASEDQKRAKQLLEFNINEAAQYTFYRDRDRREKLEFHDEPVYVWTNLVRDGGQNGAVFVWTWRGRPEVVASFHTNRADGKEGKRNVTHELHSLSPKLLVVERAGPERWEPRTGLALKLLPGAPPPAESPRQRLIQMRELMRDFSARSIDHGKQPWELRLLSRPLSRYESPDSDVIDGALFAFVTSAGTDPEVIVVLEARKTANGPRWQHAVCRFSDLDLFVEYKKAQVWRSVRVADDDLFHDEQHLYRLIFDRTIDDFVAIETEKK